MSKCSFTEGDIIFKKKNGDFDFSTKFEIIKIKEERGGNWHDGIEINYNGVLKQMDTGETHIFHLETNSFMSNYRICFVCKCFIN